MPAFSVQTERNVDEDQATRNVDDAELQSTGDSAERSTQFVKNLVPNPLESYASVNFLWTLACLTKSEFNNPSIYRNRGDLSNIVFSSAGRFDDQRAKTFEGTPEYFVENFRMKSIIAPNPKVGNTNAIKIDFEIYEPYSMGLFLQSLQNAARQADYINYLTAPFVLRLDFLGFNDLGARLSPGDSPFVKPKFFVFKLVNCRFRVDAGGSRYEVEGIPFNHDAYSDTSTTLYNDITIKADETGTVDSVLNTGENSLAAALNRIEQELVESGKICIPDIYQIEFPESFDQTAQPLAEDDDQPATVDPSEEDNKEVGNKDFTLFVPNQTLNPIGQSVFDFDASTGGSFPFPREDAVLDEDTGLLVRENVTIDPVTREFRFGQRQSVLKIIDQIIMDSDYVINALKPENRVEGRIRYYKIDVQVELLDYDVLIGDFARKITFRVIPYLVHEAIFLNPNSIPSGYDQIQQTVVKGYNYIYSGQNVDLLKFEIEINNLFFVGMNPTRESNNATAASPDLQGTTEAENVEAETGSGNSEIAQAANTGRARLAKDISLLDTTAGGSGITSTQQQIAESFHKAFINGSSADLISVDIEIMGDPYWVIDSGMANYHSPATGVGSQITEDGTVNYEGGEVYIYLSFITPADVNEVTGLYNYPIIGKESPFSGIYRVVQCENVFNGGDFRQTMRCLRMPGQSVDFDTIDESLREDPDDQAAEGTLTTEPGEAKEPPTSPNQRLTPQRFCQAADAEDEDED